MKGCSHEITVIKTGHGHCYSENLISNEADYPENCTVVFSIPTAYCTLPNINFMVQDSYSAAQKTPCFYRTHRLTTTFTKAHHRYLS
jgi:hypothetical protein